VIFGRSIAANTRRDIFNPKLPDRFVGGEIYSHVHRER
jgi:hypothetical protein